LRRNWHISLVLVCVVLGILLATSFSTQQRKREALETPRKKDLINTVRELESDRDRLKREIEENRERILKHEKIAAEREGILSSYTKELEETRKAAGLSQAKGSGLVVTLGDNPQYPKDGDPNNYVIHDYDLRTVVNSLWAGGAEAISVNGQRLISTSSIRCAGGTILVNSTRLVSPFTIKAVGDPGKMTKAINEDARTKQLLNDIAKFYGLVATVEQKNEVVVPGYAGGLLVENAKVIEGGG